MSNLIILALSTAFIHTVLGPDHYLPFIVLGKARNWSMPKTLWITLVSGIGHVGSSILIGIIGIALGISLNKLESIEAFRGNIVGWALFVFGVAYTIFGIYKYFRHAHHTHLPKFMKPKAIRDLEHLPIDESSGDNTRLTPWVLFLIFVFGPCEVLIPLLLFPAYEQQMTSMLLVALVFAIVTIATMLVLVYLGRRGTSLIRLHHQERYIHLLAGLVILISASGMLFFGW
jgi:sulfite exporter TauE/SafE